MKKRICPKPGHLVRARSRSPLYADVNTNTALIVDKRGIEVRVMINGRLAWVRRDQLEVISESG